MADITDAPVPLAEQIEFIRDWVEHFGEGRRVLRGLDVLRATLATLQQHERVVAELDATKVVLEDEEAAHQDTLRLWLEAKGKHERAIAALRAAEAADEAHSNCPECEGEIMPELCPVCFPAADDARVMRRNVLADLDAASAAGDAG